MVRPAPAAARIFPSGLNAVAYSGLSLAGASGAPTGTGCPGEATSHSRSVPSAPAAARSRWSGLRLTDWTTPAESSIWAADAEPDDSSRLAVACGVCAVS